MTINHGMIHFDESSWKTIWSQQICTHPLCLLLWDQVSAEWCSSERSLHGVLHNWAPARASPQEQKQCSHRVGVGVCVCVCVGGVRGGRVKAVLWSVYPHTLSLSSLSLSALQADALSSVLHCWKGKLQHVRVFDNSRYSHTSQRSWLAEDGQFTILHLRPTGPP